MMTRAERAQLAMMLEVCAFPKPGNVDRCHDYETTRLEHFLASTIYSRPALEEAERGEGRIGEIIRHAVSATSCHGGGNTHFGAFILLVPLVYGTTIAGALKAIEKTDVSDAVAFFRAFGMTSVRVHKNDELDVNDPRSLQILRERDMTLLDVMHYSARNDMIAREWVTGFPLTRRGADLLKSLGTGRGAIVQAFLTLLASEPDTFIIKEHGMDIAQGVVARARDVLDGKVAIETFDSECIDRGINPGSIADIMIAAIFVALGEGWEWDS